MDHVLRKNLSYLFILQNFNYIIPLLLFPYLTRTLGAENFGKIAFVQAFISYFVMLTDYGFNTSSAQKIVAIRDDKSELSRVFWTTTFTKLIFALISFLIIFVLIRFVPKLEHFTILIQIAALGIITSILFPVWLFQGLEKMQFITLLNVVPRILILITTFLWVKQPGDYVIALELQVVGALLGAFACALLVWRLKIIQFFLPDVKGLKLCISDGWHIFYSGVATNFYTVTNTVVLGFMTNDLYVGIFAASEKIVRAIISILNSISQVTFPRINIYYLESKQKAIDFGSKLISILALATFTGGIFLFVAAPFLVKILFGLPQYEDSINVLRICSFLPLFAVINGIIAVNILLTFGLKKQVAMVVSAGGIFSLLLIIPAVLLYQANGVAACALLTEILILLLLIRQLKKNHINLKLNILIKIKG